MKEIIFLKQNTEKWQTFEKVLKKNKIIHPDKLAELLIEITDDLSYSRTFYPDSKSTAYLNSLAARIHQEIYRNKKEQRKSLLKFFTAEQPRLLKKYQKNLLYSFLIFSVSVCIGWISTANDAGFSELILGETYIKMTMENIDKNDPMAIYKQKGETSSFLFISSNNIRVALLAFVSGITLSLGTAIVLFYNGIMLGVFHYIFYTKGLLATMMTTVWIHGTLEISAIIISGAAGFIIGNSILFPGTYSRTDSFKLGAQDGVKVILGVVPVFIAAGFLEGFITRLTEMPLYIKLSIIGISLIYIVWFYIVYPRTRKLNL